MGSNFKVLKFQWSAWLKTVPIKKILFICTLVRYFQMLRIRKTNFGVDMAINRFGHMGGQSLSDVNHSTKELDL